MLNMHGHASAQGAALAYALRAWASLYTEDNLEPCCIHRFEAASMELS